MDISDFDIVEYEYDAMRLLLNEELAVAIMIGDGCDADDEQKIHEQHIRSVWNDDENLTGVSPLHGSHAALPIACDAKRNEVSYERIGLWR